jgi:hypothetical protein
MVSRENYVVMAGIAISSPISPREDAMMFEEFAGSEPLDRTTASWHIWHAQRRAWNEAIAAENEACEEIIVQTMPHSKRIGLDCMTCKIVSAIRARRTP